MHTILLVGEDQVLLETRAAVLRRTGAEVLNSHPRHALTVQAEKECDLAILCHSLSQGLSTALAETIRARWPQTQLLLLVSDREWADAEAKSVVDAISSPEPERLIGRTADLLKRVRPSSTVPAVAV